MEKLPPEVLTMILQYLPALSIFKIRQVNQHFHYTIMRNWRAMKRRGLWINVERCPIRPGVVESVEECVGTITIYEKRQIWPNGCSIKNATNMIIHQEIYIFKDRLEAYRENYFYAQQSARLFSFLHFMEGSSDYKYPDYYSVGENRKLTFETKNPFETMQFILQHISQKFVIISVEMDFYSVSKTFRSKFFEGLRGAKINCLHITNPISADELVPVILKCKVARVKLDAKDRCDVLVYDDTDQRRIDPFILNSLLPYSAFCSLEASEEFLFSWDVMLNVIRNWMEGDNIRQDIKICIPDYKAYHKQMSELDVDFVEIACESDYYDELPHQYTIKRGCDDHVLHVNACAKQKKIQILYINDS